MPAQGRQVGAGRTVRRRAHRAVAADGDPRADRAGQLRRQPKELRELVKLAQDGTLPALPVAMVPQSQANDALMRLRDGKVTGRLILRSDAA